MKILFVLPEYIPHSGGGISTYYKELIPTLRPYCERIKVMVGSGYTQGGTDFVKDGIEVTYLKQDLFRKYVTKFSKFSVFPNILKNIAAAWAMWEQLENEDFDIVECTDFGLGFVPWIIKQKIPVKIQFHGSSGQIGFFDPRADEVLEIDFTKHIELSFFQYADILQSHSSDNMQFWQQYFKSSIHTVFPIYQNITPQTKFGHRDKHALVCGRIQYWKGPTITCEAVKLMDGQKVAVKWLGRDMQYLEDHISMSKWLESRYSDIWLKYVNPIGTVSHSDIHQMQGSAYFGLVPSVWDMFNFCCVEFMAAGTLTVCSDGAGASELVQSGKNGFSYSKEDPKELADILYKINTLSEIEYNNLALSGQETIRNKLSPTSLVEKYLAIFRGAVDGFNAKELNYFVIHSYLPNDKIYPLKYMLDKQPLKEIVSYALGRFKNKIYNQNRH